MEKIKQQPLQQWQELVGNNMSTKDKEFIQEIDLNKSSEACPTCASECEKINRRINGREISKIETKEFPQILKVFNK